MVPLLPSGHPLYLGFILGIYLSLFYFERVRRLSIFPLHARPPLSFRIW
jgi:hypothetical protein